MTNTTCATGREANASTHGDNRDADVLQMPHQGQTDHNHTHHDAINNEDFQAVGLQISNQPEIAAYPTIAETSTPTRKGMCIPAGKPSFLSS